MFIQPVAFPQQALHPIPVNGLLKIAFGGAYTHLNRGRRLCAVFHFCHPVIHFYGKGRKRLASGKQLVYLLATL
jgi:hypothetical protein